MADTRFTLHCPKCGKRALKLPAKPDLNNLYTCASCKRKFPMREFKTAAGKPLTDELFNLARKGFKRP